MPLLDDAIRQRLSQYPGGLMPGVGPQSQSPNLIGDVMQRVTAPYQQFQQRFARDPREAIRPTSEETQNALRMAMAVGGADITKEQRAAWEAENAAYREKNLPATRDLRGTYPPGTRVHFRPGTRDEKAMREFAERGGVPYGQGRVVVPGTPEAGKPGHQLEKRHLESPDPNLVPVRGEGSPWWFWRHRDSLEVLPPLEKFPVGTKVEYVSHSPGRAGVLQQPWAQAQVTEPPRGSKPPGPDYVWVDYEAHPEMGLRHPFGGGWYHVEDLVKKK